VSGGILFLSPHPDDVEIFCGGTVARCAREGRAVHVVDLTAGEMATNGDVVVRRRESVKSLEALGVTTERGVLGLPDGGLDANDPLQLRELVGCVRQLRPEVLVAPWVQDRHPDHVATGELARRAMFFAGVRRYDAPGEAWRPRRLLHYPCHHEVAVQILVDISAEIEAWRAAVACYTSQFQRTENQTTQTPINDPTFLVAHEARRTVWGRSCGTVAAEGFVHEGAWRSTVNAWFEEAGEGGLA
jgi:bacillithiol biosynthesis deacetylase BshB1